MIRQWVNSSNVTWLAHQRRALCRSQKKQRQTTDIVSRVQQGGYVFMVVWSINAVKSILMTVAFFCMGMPYLCNSTTEKQASDSEIAPGRIHGCCQDSSIGVVAEHRCLKLYPLHHVTVSIWNEDLLSLCWIQLWCLLSKLVLTFQLHGTAL
jgi:hypothetical protein